MGFPKRGVVSHFVGKVPDHVLDVVGPSCYA